MPGLRKLLRVAYADVMRNRASQFCIRKDQIKDPLAAILFCLTLLQCGCGVAVPFSYNKEKLSQLQILMTQQQVRRFIGDPDEVRGSLKNVDGDILTVWQYDLYKKSSAWTNLGLGNLPILHFNLVDSNIGKL